MEISFQKACNSEISYFPFIMYILSVVFSLTFAGPRWREKRRSNGKERGIRALRIQGCKGGWFNEALYMSGQMSAYEKFVSFSISVSAPLPGGQTAGANGGDDVPI